MIGDAAQRAPERRCTQHGWSRSAGFPRTEDLMARSPACRQLDFRPCGPRRGRADGASEVPATRLRGWSGYGAGSRACAAHRRRRRTRSERARRGCEMTGVPPARSRCSLRPYSRSRKPYISPHRALAGMETARESMPRFLADLPYAATS